MRAIGTVEFRECADGIRRAHRLQSDGSWIPAAFCTCKYTVSKGSNEMEFSADCPIDRHAIDARMRELKDSGVDASRPVAPVTKK